MNWPYTAPPFSNRWSLEFGPQHRRRPRVEPARGQGFAILEELRLDADRAVVAQLAAKVIRPAHKLEQHFTRLRLARRRDVSPDS